MKRLFWMTFVGLGAVVLGGCPIYSDNGNSRICNESGCYNCPGGSLDESCSGWQCNTSSDCPNGYLCSDQGYCVAGSVDGGTVDGSGGSCSTPAGCPAGDNCGADNTCHAGDCTTTGCPSPLVCKLSNGVPACVSLTDGGGTAVPDAGADAPTFSGCSNNSDCIALGPGAQCLDGTCVAASNQCSDTTQCPGTEECVNGACTPACSATNPCLTGYSCDTNGTCTGNPDPCGASGETCPSGTTCVEQHCVAPCGANNACPTNEVCIDGGCLPNQQPNFVCNTDGQAGDGKAGDCQVGSVCLHHSCYIACDPEAGANTCTTADQFNQCKQVSTSDGTYFVCGSSTNLGNQCDPTQGEACANANDVCIDGYCK